MVNKRRGNEQGVKGAAIDLEVVSSRLMDVDVDLTLVACTSSHLQVVFMEMLPVGKDKVLLDLWPTTGKFRVHDASQGSPAVVGSADDVLEVVEWLLNQGRW